MLTEFILYLTEQLGEPYLWGGQHTKLTPSNYVKVITDKESDPKHRADAIAYCKKLFDAGATVLYAYDCSGLGMYWLQNVMHIYKNDMSANSMMKQCDIVSSAKTGYWVFRTDNGKATHIGYMISDTELIEAKGRKYGVVKTKYNPAKWDVVGRPKCFNFDPEPTHKYVYVKGNSVRVRAGNGTNTKCIGIAHKGDTFPCYGQADADPHWYMIQYRGADAFITCNQRYTTEVYKP